MFPLFQEPPNMNASEVPLLVTSQWVKEHIDQIVVVDGHWDLPPAPPHEVQLPGKNSRTPLTSPPPNSGRRSSASLGALRFDVDEVADRETYKNQPVLPLPHMVPSETVFSDWMNSNHVGKDDHVVVYDHSGGMFLGSARVWWTFRVTLFTLPLSSMHK